MLRLANCERNSFPTMFEASQRVEIDAGINKASAWTEFVKSANENPLTAAEMQLITRVQSEAGVPLLNNAELTQARMDVTITASTTVIKAAIMDELRKVHDLADFIAQPPKSGDLDSDAVQSPWQVLTFLYKKDGPSEVALFGYYVSDKGTCQNYIALSNFINTNAKAAQRLEPPFVPHPRTPTPTTARPPTPPAHAYPYHGQARHERTKTSSGKGGGKRKSSSQWDQPKDVFEAMGESGLVVCLRRGSLLLRRCSRAR